MAFFLKGDNHMNEFLSTLSTYAIVFAVGGFVCMLAQILIIKTKLTPARILVIFLILGIVLEGIGVYDIIFKYAQAGISVPIVGFGAALAKGDRSRKSRRSIRCFFGRAYSNRIRYRRCRDGKLSCHADILSENKIEEHFLFFLHIYVCEKDEKVENKTIYSTFCNNRLSFYLL